MTETFGQLPWSAADCVQVLYRRRTTLVAVISAAVFATLVASILQPRWYQSSASLEVLGLNDNFLNTRDINPSAGPGSDSTGVYVQTQAELLEQNTLIEMVVQDLHLQEKAEFRASPTLWQRLIASPGDERQRALQNTVEEVKKHIKVLTSRNSRIVEITAEARKAGLAADIANTLAHRLIQQRSDDRQRTAEQIYQSLRTQLEQLRSALIQTQAKLAGVPVPGFGVFRRAPSPMSDAGRDALERDLAANRRFYEVMQQRVNDAAIAAAVRQPTIRIISFAQPAPYPYRPNLPVNMAIGTIGGLLAAIGWVMFREQTRTVVQSPAEASTYLTIPELGAIPRVRILDSRQRIMVHGESLQTNGASDGEGLNHTEPFRATVTSILSAHHNGHSPRSFVVTSANAMEGKTTVVSQLGIALAEISSRVLLIDGDLRRPQLHKLFGQSNSWGLTDILQERNAIETLPLDSLVRRTGNSHLYLLPSGPSTVNIFGLLYSARLCRLLPRFRDEFEYVLFDAPPCLEFADARIMARYAEQTLLVVSANSTARTTAQQAVRRLQLDGISVMGVILNNWEPASPETSYYYDSRNQIA